MEHATFVDDVCSRHCARSGANQLTGVVVQVETSAVKPDEFLESAFKDSFKRELEVDENVARTLPFFAATLALGATLYNFIIGRLPPFGLDILSLVLHGLLAIAGGCLAAVVWTLFQAVRQRQYRIPPKETELLTWSQELAEHFTGEGLKPSTVETRVVEQLRDRLIYEYAASAEHNRDANKPKLQARALGFTLLVVMLGIAFLMIGIMFVAARVSPPAEGAVHVTVGQGESATGRAAGVYARQGSAAAAQGAGAECGREIPGCADRQPGAGPQVTQPPKAPQPQSAAAPAGAAPKPIPQPPSHQILKKSEDGGGPLVERR